MKKIYTLRDLPTISLGITERLGLFCENSADIRSKKGSPFYDKGWFNVESMWDYRWEPGNASGSGEPKCKSLAWLAKPIRIGKKVATYNKKCSTPFSILEEDVDHLHATYPGCEITWHLKDLRTLHGHHDKTVLEIFVERQETSEEFQKRKVWQERHINKVIKEDLAARDAEVRTKKEQRKKQFDDLKKEFG